MTHRDKAASSLYALIVVLAITLMCGAALAGAYAFRNLERKAKESGERREALDAVLAGWVESFEKKSGSADSSFDTLASSTAEGFEIEAQDISSKLNPNWVRKSLLQKTALSGLLMPDVSADELQQYREDNGFSQDIESFYGKFFKPEAFESLLTPYSYADINTSDEFALASLYKLKTGDDTAAESFHSRVRGVLSALTVVKAGELRDFLSPHYDTVFPTISSEAPLNVNFVPERILQAVLSYPDYGITDFADRSSAIIAERSRGAIDMERLLALVGVARENSVYRYLGVKTWFWRVEVSSSAEKLEAIVARIPPGPGRELESDSTTELSIISRKIVP